MIEGPEGVTWEHWVALAEACERGGLDALFRSDHYLAITDGEARGGLDAWACLTALAARTERLRLGTLVSPATFRHPSELARVVTTADHVSGGRVELGLGAGWYEAEHVSFGFPFPDLGTRMELFEEQLEIVSRQWTEDEFDFHGRHYRLERCRAQPKPLQRPRPPIVVGGSARRRSVAAAVRFADEYNVHGLTPEECGEARSRVDAACRDAGRDPLRLTLMTVTAVGSDRAEAEARVRALGSPRTDAWLAGTPEEVVERMRRYAAAGVDGVYLQHLAADVEMVDLVGAEVVPALAG
jgi:F420-dependent oxidoreductase-like protein